MLLTSAVPPLKSNSAPDPKKSSLSTTQNAMHRLPDRNLQKNVPLAPAANKAQKKEAKNNLLQGEKKNLLFFPSERKVKQKKAVILHIG